MSKNSDRKLRRYGIIPASDRADQARERMFYAASAAPDGLRRDYVNTTISHIRGEGATIHGSARGKEFYREPNKR